MLHVDDAGSGRLPVVFVHSFAGSSSHWKAQLAHLRTQRREIGPTFGRMEHLSSTKELGTTF